MSANGTFVNGAKSNISYLSAGDQIRFGPIDCVFQLPSSATQAGRQGKARAFIIAGIAFLVTAAALVFLVRWLS